MVSIIIPTYNRGHLIGETLESILAQTYQYWECIVVDDGSEDYTLELMNFYIKKDSRFSFYKRPKNKPKGANACRNYGFEICKGDFIIFFDSDDLMSAQNIEIHIRNFSQDFDFSVSEVIFFKDLKKNIFRDWKGEIISKNSLLSYVKGNISWLTSSIVWRKSFLELMDYIFDEELQAGQEWELNVRVLLKNPEFNLLKKDLVFMRMHTNSITYGMKYPVRQWHYYLARLKIYENTENKRKDVKDYLRQYLLDGFKSLCREENPYVWKAFWLFIFKNKKIKGSTKFFAFSSICCYRLFRKGDFLLKNI